MNRNKLWIKISLMVVAAAFLPFMNNGAVVDILGLILLSIPIIFWLGLLIYFALLLSKWRLKDIRKNYSDYFFSIGVLLFFACIAGVITYFEAPAYRVGFNRAKAHIEGKHLLPSEFDEEVFVCTGDDSFSYHHDKYCKGLKSCGEIKVKMELCDAEDNNFSPCKICYMIGEKYYKR